MTEKTWRQITGTAGAVIGMLAIVVLIERLRWLVGPILTTLAPFVIAVLIAFLLNPLLVRLERRGMSRALSVLLTSLVFLLIFAGTILLLVPQLVAQGTDLAHSMPDYVRALEQGVNNVLSRQEALLQRFNLPTTVSALLGRFSSQIRGFSTSALTAVSDFVLASASKMTWLLIIPLLTVWLLVNWDGQREAFHGLLPDAHRDRITRVIQSVGRVLNSYVRGALVLAALYGVTTALVLGLIFRMPYALVLGLVAGLVSPIPYIGSIVILLSTGIVAYATNPSLSYVGAVLGAMIVQNNILFDNIVSPRVLGGSVGLSLPWSVFALMLGGSLFGVAGMILAVPVGAAIKVLVLELFPKLRGEEPEEQSAEE
jgi:predicted PurR-regulated permease PerM